MTQRLLALLVLVISASTGISAQKLALETYHVTVITKAGDRFKGLLEDVTPIALYCGPGSQFTSTRSTHVVPLEEIRKVILRRTNKRLAVRAGAAVGALVFGFLTVQGLQRDPTRSLVASGLTLLLAGGTGAAMGAGVGSVLGTIPHRVVLPRDRENSLDDFRRQLEPFSIRYQNDVFNRVSQ